MGPTAPACPVCEGAEVRFFADVGGREYLRCETCEATFLTAAQRPGRAEEKREYDRHRNDIDDPGYRRFLSRLTEPLLQRVPAGSEGLDYGCGAGPALAAMLSEAGHRVRLYDPIFHPDAAVLEQYYDFITCTEVVEHMHRPAGEFRRLNALLRPGGRLGVMTNFQTEDARFADWHYRRDPTHVVFYRESTLAFIADRMGWSMEIPRANVAIFRKHQQPDPQSCSPAKRSAGGCRQITEHVSGQDFSTMPGLRSRIHRLIWLHRRKSPKPAVTLRINWMAHLRRFHEPVITPCDGFERRGILFAGMWHLSQIYRKTADLRVH